MARVAAWVLVVLMGIAVAGSVVGFWVNRTVLETDRFMAVVTPIVESESVQAVVSDRVADQLLEALDLETRLTERLSEADDRLRERLGEALDLPDVIVRRLQNTRLGLESLAPMIAAGVETRIREAVTTFISSREGNAAPAPDDRVRARTVGAPPARRARSAAERRRHGGRGSRQLRADHRRGAPLGRQRGARLRRPPAGDPAIRLGRGRDRGDRSPGIHPRPRPAAGLRTGARSPRRSRSSKPRATFERSTWPSGRC